MKYLQKFSDKIDEYCKRYWLAEIISYSLAIGCSSYVYYQTNDVLLSGMVVIIWDNIWYYGTMFFKELYYYKQGSLITSKIFRKSISSMSIEFWFPQVLETFVIYPIMVYNIPPLFDNYSLWVFLTMTLTVLIFYLQAIILYEIKKKYFNY